MYLDAPGGAVGIAQLQVAKAKAFADYIASEKHKYARFIEARKESATGSETVVCDLIVEVSQDRANDIRDIERVAVTFDANDEQAPEVVALRDDFPTVPHLNQRPTDFPRSLCLYAVPYTSTRLRWTPTMFVERIRQWLEQTASGTLHQEDQPLEPVFLGHFPPLIVPSNFLQTISDVHTAGGQAHFSAYATGPAPGTITGFVAVDPNSPNANRTCEHIATAIVAPPQTHGVVQKTPTSLSDVVQVAQDVGVDLLSYLRRYVRELKNRDLSLLSARLILIMVFPKRRYEHLAEEAWEWWGFLIDADIRRLGDKLGVWQVQADGTTPELIPVGSETTNEVQVGIVNPVTQLTKQMAATFNGTAEDTRRFLMVGAGALGSMTLLNLLRKGFGFWDVVDDDIMMPHNGARHALPALFSGGLKVTGMQQLAASLYEATAVNAVLACNVLHPGAARPALEERFQRAQVIVDCSADVAVARHLANDIDSDGRRVSIFLSPGADQLVLLVEDEMRHAKLDTLEMQFYRLLLDTHALSEHYGARGKKLRYGRSCRDLSGVLSSDGISAFAGISSRALERSLSQSAASVSVWKMTEDGSVQLYSTAVRRVHTVSTSGFRIVWHDGVVDKLRWLRGEKLPGETGGALIGCWDLSRSTLYIVDVTGAPSDSIERPTAFIRGSKQLPEWLQAISRITGGAGEYVGEWHSHPDGYGTSPSPDDKKVFMWVEEHLDRDGLPAVILIVGETDMRWVTTDEEGGVVWNYPK